VLDQNIGDAVQLVEQMVQIRVIVDQALHLRGKRDTLASNARNALPRSLNAASSD